MLDHVASEDLAAAPEPVDVDVHDLIPFVLGDVERGTVDARPRVVDEDVDAPVALDDRGERAPDVARVAHVEMHPVDVVTDPLGRLPRALVIPRRDHDRRADVHEAPNPGRAEAAVAACHDRDLAAEVKAVEHSHRNLLAPEGDRTSHVPARHRDRRLGRSPGSPMGPTVGAARSRRTENERKRPPDHERARRGPRRARPDGDRGASPLRRWRDEERDCDRAGPEPLQGRPAARARPCHRCRAHRDPLSRTDRPRPVGAPERGIRPPPLRGHGRSRGRRRAAARKSRARCRRTACRDRRARRRPGVGVGAVAHGDADLAHATGALRRRTAHGGAGAAQGREPDRAGARRGAVVRRAGVLLLRADDRARRGHGPGAQHASGGRARSRQVLRGHQGRGRRRRVAAGALDGG